MARARRARATARVGPPEPPPASASWTRSTEWIAPSGRHVGVGTELSIKRERGRFRFQEIVVTETGATWIYVVGGPKGVRVSRFFHPDRVRTVHVKKTTMTTTEAAELVRAKKREKRAAV